MSGFPDLPRTLGERIGALDARGEVQKSGSVTAFPHAWQLPAATEKAAYEAMLEAMPADFEYWGFPWATIIDGLRRRAPAVWDLLLKVQEAAGGDPSGVRRATVVQHIHAGEYIELFAASGITDLFWSHATVAMTDCEGMKIHPFPLFPAQAPNPAPIETIRHERRYLANFIGAYNTKIYLSNVRDVIFADAGKAKDVHVVRRDAWHFDRTVYDEQIAGRTPDEQERAVERRRTQEYLEAIRNSWFTLCPTGSGPNSIRLFECLALGSIPIILTEELRLPGDPSLWNEAALVAPDTARGYRIALNRARMLSNSERWNMVLKGQELFEQVGPAGYGSLLCHAMRASTAETYL